MYIPKCEPFDGELVLEYETESWRSRFGFYTFISTDAVLPRSENMRLR